MQRRNEVLAPLSFGVWVLPILGFIGTVIGITEAIGELEPLLKRTGAQIGTSMTDSMSGVLTGLKYAFDTTLVGLLLVIPTMLLSMVLRNGFARLYLEIKISAPTQSTR